MSARGTMVVGNVIIQRNRVAGHFQTVASCHRQVIRFHAFQHLHYGLAGGQERDSVLEEPFAGTVDKGALPIAQNIKPHQESAVEGLASSCFQVRRTEEILDSITEQKLVTELLVAIPNRLPGNKAEVLE
jgi:hypothetical protein